MPPVVRFKGIETVASINRLAAFTGVRFFRSCAIQCLAVTRDGTTCYSTPSTVRSVDIDPFRPESISLLIQIIEGHAPKRITLQQAFDIFAVFEYCLADSLFELLPEYLDPLLERLNAHEVRGRSTLPVLGPACVCVVRRSFCQMHGQLSLEAVDCRLMRARIGHMLLFDNSWRSMPQCVPANVWAWVQPPAIPAICRHRIILLPPQIRSLQPPQ